MNAVSLNNLWTYLQGLSLSASNQRWFGERLIEASAAATGKTSKPQDYSPQRAHRHRKRLSDKELAACLAQYAPLTDADFPDVSAESYTNYAKHQSGRLTKGIEKWL